MNTIICPCGFKFDGDKSPIRNAKDQQGNFLNDNVRQHSTTGHGSRYEHQCPKCKLWFDSVLDIVLEAESTRFDQDL